MQRKPRIIAIVIITIAILISMFCVWPVNRLNSFYDAESNAVSRFDTLNSELFVTIPPPNGVIELEQFSSGIVSPSTEHGRYLTTDYQMLGTSTSDILKYL